MPDTSTILSLPLILPAQAQKHVTHNEALRLLDIIVQLAVKSRIIATPPAAVAGDRYIVPIAATGVWAGQTGKIALYEDSVWQFITPLAGWQAWVLNEGALAGFNGTSWATLVDAPLTVGQLGVSATPDATNRLSVSSPATLLNHAGAGHQLKLNKAAGTDTTSLLFQTGFSGRAEMGTMGSDDFGIKVSPNGSSFFTALTVARTDGQVTLPAALKLGGQASDPVSPPNGAIWLNTTTSEVKVRSNGVSVVVATATGGVTDGDKGDVTVTSSGAVWTIDPGVISNTKLAPVATATFKGRVTAGPGAPEDLTGAQATGLLDTVTTAAKGLAPASGGGTANFLRADGTWTVPVGAVTDGDKGDLTVTGSGTVWTVDPGAISNAKLATVATATFKGRSTAGSGAPEDLTATQATALLNTVTTAVKGLAPASGGGTTNFLRADGTWVAPPAGGGVTDGLKGDIKVSGAGTIWSLVPAVEYGMPLALQSNIFFN